jgi:hypothetical protein
MHWGVVPAKVIDHLEFAVTFADGVSDKVKMPPSPMFGVFECLKDPAGIQPVAG